MKKLFLTLFAFTLFASCSAIPQEQSQNLEGDISPETTLPEGESSAEEQQILVQEFIKIIARRNLMMNRGSYFEQFAYVSSKLGDIVSRDTIYKPKNMLSASEGEFEVLDKNSNASSGIVNVKIENNNSIYITEHNGQFSYYQLM